MCGVLDKPSALPTKVSEWTKGWDPLTSELTKFDAGNIQKTAANPLLSTIATGVAGAFGGPWGAALAQSSLAKERGNSWGDALLQGAAAGGMTYAGQSLGSGGGDTGLSGGEIDYGTGSSFPSGTGGESFSTPMSYGGNVTTDFSGQMVDDGAGWSGTSNASFAGDPTVSSSSYDPSLFGSDSITPASEQFAQSNMPTSWWDDTKSYMRGDGLSKMGKMGRLQMINGGMETLAGLYGAREQRKQADSLMELYNTQMNELNSMYAPGTPEYEALKQQIERQDAASGRNSQYGQRAVDLAARTNMIRQQEMSRRMPTLSNIYGQAQGMRGSAKAGIAGGLGRVGQGWALSSLF